MSLGEELMIILYVDNPRKLSFSFKNIQSNSRFIKLKAAHTQMLITNSRFINVP